MNSLIVRYVLSRFIGITLLIFACWNFYLLRLLNEWLPIDLIHIALGIGGCFVLGTLVLWRARVLLREAPTTFHFDISSIHRSLNLLFIVVLMPLAIGDVMTVSDFVASAKLVDDGEISEAAYVARDTAIARICAYVLLAIYLGLGAHLRGITIERKSKGPPIREQ